MDFLVFQHVQLLIILEAFGLFSSIGRKCYPLQLKLQVSCTLGTKRQDKTFDFTFDE